MRGRWLRCERRSWLPPLPPYQRIELEPSPIVGRELKARDVIPGFAAFTEVWIVAGGGVGALRRFAEVSWGFVVDWNQTMAKSSCSSHRWCLPEAVLWAEGWRSEARARIETPLV